MCIIAIYKTRNLGALFSPTVVRTSVRNPAGSASLIYNTKLPCILHEMLSFLLSGWSVAATTVLILAIWLNVPGSLWSFYRQWRASRGVPGWPTHWLYGNLHQMRKLDEAVLKTSNQYIFSNHYKMTRLWLGPFYVCIGVHHPSCVKELFKHSKDAGIYKILKPWVSESMILAEGKKWFRKRRLLTPAFHCATLKPYVSVYNSCIQTLIGKWTVSSEKGDSVKLFDTVSLASLDIILQCTFSYEGDCQKSRPPYVEAVKKLLFAMTERFFNPLYQINWLYQLTPHGRRLKQLCKLVHDYTDTVIEERKKALGLTGNQKIVDMTSFLEKESKSRRLDLLDILLTASDENGVGLSDLEIRNEVDTFMFAGHDTTTSGMCWTLYCLAQHPEHQQKVREEVNSVLSGREHLTYDDLKELKYTQCCIKEALRLYTPGGTIFRQLDHDLEIDGQWFPKGMHFYISIESIHNNPDVWPDPEIYDPMRFHPSHAESRDPHAYLPFSAGSRNCIGQNFAMNEQKTVIASLLNRFRLSVDQNHKVEMLPRIVLKAKNDIRVFVEPIS